MSTEDAKASVTPPDDQRAKQTEEPEHEDDVDILDEFSIVNEFAVAWVRKVRTRNGERLELHSPRFGYTIRLDAVTLEALSWQPPEVTSQFLEAPLGPDRRLPQD